MAENRTILIVLGNLHGIKVSKVEVNDLLSGEVSMQSQNPALVTFPTCDIMLCL